jgi:hypothetical protein
MIAAKIDSSMMIWIGVSSVGFWVTDDFVLLCGVVVVGCKFMLLGWN